MNPRSIALLLAVPVWAADPSALMKLSEKDLSAGHYAKAIEEGDRAAALFRGARDRVNEAGALTITGVAHIYAGEYPAALKDSGQALKIARDTGDHDNEATRLNNIGNVYYFEGRYSDALEQYDAAIRVVEAHPNEKWSTSRRQLTVANLASLYQRLGQYDRALTAYSGLRVSHAALTTAEQAQLLANMGSLYRRLGDPVKALETYRAAQQLYRREELRHGEIAVLNNVGIAQALDLRQLPQALDTFDQALRMAAASRDKPMGLRARLYRAETLFRMGRPGESAKDFTAAAALADELDAVEEKWKALYGLARIAEHDGELNRSTSLLREAIALIESLRGSGPVALRGGFLADKRQVYDLLIRQLAGQSEPNVGELFRLMELSRARTLQDQKSANVSLASVQKLLPPDTLLLEYWIGDESLAVLWATAEGSGIGYRNAVAGLRGRLETLRSMLKNPGSEAWKPVAAAIAHELLDGTGGRPADPAIRRLVIVPDREAAGIPFEALPLPSGGVERLVDKFAISYLPSASLLRGPENHRAWIPFWRRTILAFADPAPGGGEPSFDLLPGGSAGRLPAATDEVRDIAAVVGGRAALFIGASAVKTNLNRSLPLHYEVVHFATHAFSDPEDPARSYVLLAASKPTQAWDYLFLNEVAAMDLRGVDLVTLSACNTETGRLVEGEGVEGFSRAFLKAGTRAVVTSLWQVEDQATADLMRIFYRNLAGGALAAEALRDAKSEYLRSASGRRQHPFYWAAFVLNGDAGVRISFVVPWTFAAAGVFGLAGFCGLLWSLRKGVRRASASERCRPRSVP